LNLTNVCICAKGELTDGVIALSDNAKKMHQAHQQTIEVGHAASASLKYLLQRVATEKISLSSALAHAEGEVEEVRNKLQGTISEINGKFTRRLCEKLVVMATCIFVYQD
jgi:hypothetical protein